MSGTASNLAVLLDGASMTEEDGRALWKEFSEYMDEHQGDMPGFAKKKGWFSVLPEFRNGKAVLVVRTKEAPRAVPGKGRRRRR